MKFLSLLTTLAATAENGTNIIFQPGNFVSNLKYMGLGMLVIFVVIGIIILVTLMINKLFAD